MKTVSDKVVGHSYPKPYLVAVLPRRKDSSCSLSHLLMSILFYINLTIYNYLTSHNSVHR